MRSAKESSARSDLAHRRLGPNTHNSTSHPWVRLRAKATVIRTTLLVRCEWHRLGCVDSCCVRSQHGLVAGRATRACLTVCPLAAPQGLMVGPLLHTWHGTIERLMPSVANTLPRVAFKVVLETVCVGPVMISGVFAWTGALSGRTRAEIVEKIKRDTPVAWTNALMVFGPSAAVSYLFVPVAYVAFSLGRGMGGRLWVTACGRFPGTECC